MSGRDDSNEQVENLIGNESLVGEEETSDEMRDQSENKSKSEKKETIKPENMSKNAKKGAPSEPEVSAKRSEVFLNLYPSRAGLRPLLRIWVAAGSG